MTHPLQPIFEPRSVAIVGASANPAKRGYQVVAALGASGFEGPVYPVNPRGGEILGRPAYASVDDLPEAPDLAYIATPAASVPDVVAACGRRGIRGAIVPAVGFRESGDAGRDLETRLLEAARKTGIRVIGPNTSGLLNTHARVHMVGGEPLAPGGIAILAQSGNVALDLMTAAGARPIGVSIYVGPGNETDVAFHECLDFLGQHEPTRAIAMYVEGVHDGRALYETACRVARQKPIVVLKGGRSAAGVSAARSHTGAIAGSYEVFSALARQGGMTEVRRSDELLPVAETLATQPLPGGRGVVVLSDGGGHATLTVDGLTEAGVPLAELGPSTRAALSELLGPAASARNPIDLAGAADGDPAAFGQTLDLLTADSACGTVMMTGLFGGYGIRFSSSFVPEEEGTAARLATLTAERGCGLVVHSLYASRASSPLRALLEGGVPVSGSLEIAVRCVRALYDRERFLERVPVRRSSIAAGRPGFPVAAPRSGPSEWLSELETRRVLEGAGVPLVDAIPCADADAAAAVAGRWEACALKVVSPSLPHKTDAGGVALGLRGPEETRAAFERTAAAARAYLEAKGLPADLRGALVSPMLEPPVAELIVAVRRDAEYGPILTLGPGGTDAELFGDIAIRALPIGDGAVGAMCGELRAAGRLRGTRGRPGVDLEALGRLIGALAGAFLAAPELLEIELNPVFAYRTHCVVVDAIGRVA